MKNNKGFMRFEVMTIVAILLVVFAFLFYIILNSTSSQKFETMKENANSLAKAVATNISSFHYSNTVYLGEVIDEGFLHSIKNPFGGGDCDVSESRVDIVDGKAYATLKCGKYLLEKVDFSDTKDVPFYEVGDWSEKQPEGEDVEEETLYNCLEDDKEVFDHYLEELYFVYRVNKQYETDVYFAKDVDNSGVCEVVSKTFYRNHKEVEQK